MKTKKNLLIAILSVVLVAAIALVTVLIVVNNKTPDQTASSGGDSGDKETYYVVTYDADGKTTAQNVAEGKSAVKPADPVKDGYAFFGWYTDEDYKNAFSFNTSITENVTLYARFVNATVTADEFEVKFVKDGAELTAISTQNKVVPAFPAEMGEGFVGWWVSSYEDEDKLSYQYDDRAIEQDMTLYAVYDNGAPSVSVSESGIAWSGAGADATYTVRVTDTYGYTLERKTKALFYDYSFGERDPGDYVVSVSIGDKSNTAYFKNKALAKVSHFDVDGSILMFNRINGADNYTLSIDCGDDEHVHSALDLATNTYYDFANCPMQEGGIRFTVTASADGYASSVAEYVFDRTLDGSVNAVVSADVGLVSWTAVDGAEYYTVKIVNGDDTIEEYVGKATSYSLKGYTGDLAITVYAEAKGYNPAVSTVNYNKTSIAAPENVKVLGSDVSWTAVEGATGYTVKVNGAEYAAEGTTFDLTSAGVSGNSYTVSVKANGANGSDSLYGDVVSVKDKMTENDVVYGDGVLSWNPVASAVKYIIKVNNTNAVEVTDGSTSANVSFAKAGDNIVSISYVDAADNASSEIMKRVTTYAINFMTDEDTKIATEYYAQGDVIEFPTTVSRTGYTLGNWYNAVGGSESNAAKFSDKTFEESASINLYASWIPNKYTITMVAGENGELTQETAEIKYNEYYTLPIPVSKDPYKGFIGWYSQEDVTSGMRYADGFGESLSMWSLPQDATVYARWEDLFVFTLNEDKESYAVSKSSYASSVSEITVPATYNGKPVTVIDSQAFYYCRSLDTINIPDSIQIIEIGTAFQWCDSLQNINIYESDVNVKGDFYSLDGVLFRKNTYENVIEIKYLPLGRKGTYHIPATLTVKDENGDEFEQNVEQIPVSAFRQSAITEVYIPYTVKAVQANAFYNSKNLENVVFEATPDGEEDVPLELASSAFYQCDKLRSITFPTRIVGFSSKILTYCSSLEYIDIVGENDEISSVEGMITNKDKDTLLYVPAGRKGTVEIPYGVHTVAANAFRTEVESNGNTYYSACTKITKVVIPEWVTEIGEAAFYGCNQMKEVVFNGTKDDSPLTIGEYAFYNTGLTSLVLAENVQTIGQYAFGMTRQLTRVTINSAYDVSNSFVAHSFTADDASYTCYVNVIKLGELTGLVDIANAFNVLSIASVEVADGSNHVIGEDGVLYYGDTETLEFYPINRVGEYVVPDTVTAIPANFFTGNMLLTSITIGKGVKTIGAEAFKNCYSLETVNFAEDGALEKIEDKAFQNCRKLTALSLPASVKDIGTGTSMLIVDGCELIDKITISADSDYLVYDEYNILYSKDYTKLYTCFSDVTGDADGKLVIKEATQVIGDRAFGNIQGVKEIQFAGNNITTVGVGLFTGNTSIEEIELPSSITVIGEDMFKGCTNLKKFTVAANVTAIKVGAFDGCSNLEEFTFAEGRTEPIVFEDTTPSIMMKPASIPERLSFSGTPKLGEIVFPENTTVGYAVFKNSGITKATFLGDATLGAYAFSEANSLTEVTFNGDIDFAAFSYTYGEGKSAQTTKYDAGVNCFQACSKLTTVTFSDESTFEAFPNYFFTNCTVLENVNIPSSVKTFGTSLFNNAGLKSFTIPATVTTLGSNCFYGCKSLASVTFDDESTITTIPGYCFYNCTSLTSVHLPESVKEIGVGTSPAFKGCTSLTEINIPRGVTAFNYQTFYNCGFTSFEVPKQIVSIGQGAFDSCTELETVTFEEGSRLAAIGTQAFDNCISLKEFTFPTIIKVDEETGDEYVASISMYDSYTMFQNCELEKVVLSPSITSIRQIVNKATINNIEMPEESGFTLSADGIVYKDDKKVVVYALDYSGGSELVIPEGVTKIQQYAFYGNRKITKVVIPSTVNSLGAYAFQNCVKLQEVVFADDSQITVIPSYCFSDCESLTTVRCASDETTDRLKLPESVTALAMYSFRNCLSLANVDFNNVHEFSGGVFYGCTSLSEINLSGITDYYDATTSAISGAFYGCTSLTKVDFGNSTLPYLMNSMFYNCSNLTTVTLNENQKNIEQGVFQNCSKLTAVDLSNVVESKYHYNGNDCNGVNVFSGCSSLTEVKLNDSWTQIGQNMFMNCSKLQSITLPKSLTVIGPSAFSGCTVLNSINSIKADVVNLPNGITKIDTSAFNNCKAFKEVTLPRNLETINATAFQNCTGINEIYIPADVTSVASNSFASATNLSTVTVDGGNTVYYSSEDSGVYTYAGDLLFYPAGVSGKVTILANAAIPANAFNGTTKITEIEILPGVNTIGANAFNGCKGVTKIIIPVTVRSIGQNAFSNCVKLTDIQLPISVTTLGQSAFSGDTSLETIVIPEYVEVLPNMLFSGCSNLKDVTLPSGLKSINYAVFQNCSKLETIELPEGLEALGALSSAGSSSGLGSTSQIGTVFKNCTQLKQIVIPDKVTAIYQDTFNGCTALESVTLPNGLTEIGNNAFQKCNKLVSITIPEAVTVIGAGAFSYCSAITNIVVADGNAEYKTVGGDLYTKDGMTLVSYAMGKEATEFTTDENVTTINSYAFAGANNLTSITLPDTVTTIGTYAFTESLKLASVTLSNNLTAISDYAFFKCTSLTGITLPDTVTTIGTNAFQNCNKLATVTLSDNLTSIGNSAFQTCSALTSITLPETLTTIGNNAFNGSGLKSIMLPDTVTTIGTNAFQNCKSLTSATLPETLTTISNYMFSGSGLTSITLPDAVTAIGTNAFQNCNKLATVTLSDNLTSIGNNAFQTCSALTSITLPAAVTTIGTYAFQACSALTSITLPEKVTVINNNTFQNCSKLATVTILGKVTSIGNYAFAGCKVLTDLAIPNSVTAIGTYAFQNCNAITKLVIPVKVSAINANTFNGWKANQTICYRLAEDKITFNANWSNGCAATIVFGYDGE